MGFASFNKSRFSPIVYLRGEDYNDMGNVRIVSFSGTQVNAIVDGTSPYEVRIEFAKDKHILRHNCTCPAHKGGKLCKHIAAVLFALDEPGVVPSMPAPLDPKFENEPFRYSSGWTSDSFPEKSLAEFEKLMNVPMPEFLHHLEQFHSAANVVYGYGRYRELGDLFIQVFRLFIDNESKRNAFLANLLSKNRTPTIVSVFFAKGIYNEDTRPYINEVLENREEVIAEKLTTEFANYLAPMNIFLYCSEKSLENFAKSYYFAFERDEELYVDACESKRAYSALTTLLKRTRYGRSPSAQRILEILKNADNNPAYIEAMAQGVANYTVPFDVFLETYLKTPESLKAQLENRISSILAATEEGHAGFAIAKGDRFTVNDVQRCSIKTILLLSGTIESKGTDFVSKSISKRIDKDLQILSRTFMDEEHFANLMKLIQRFARNPFIANKLRDERLIDISKRGPKTRLAYLELTESLGLLSATGVFMFRKED